jgi:hypothetical protein
METYTNLCLLLFALLGNIHSVVAGRYSEYILAPASRTLLPAIVHKVNGSVTNAASLTAPPANATFNGASAVTYDFGKNIAGIASFNVSTVTGTDEFIGISFTESSLWINSNGCDATADAGIDEARGSPCRQAVIMLHPRHIKEVLFDILTSTTIQVARSSWRACRSTLPLYLKWRKRICEPTPAISIATTSS